MIQRERLLGKSGVTSAVEVAITDLDGVDEEISDVFAVHTPHTQAEYGHFEATIECYRHFWLIYGAPSLTQTLSGWLFSCLAFRLQMIQLNNQPLCRPEWNGVVLRVGTCRSFLRKIQNFLLWQYLSLKTSF